METEYGDAHGHRMTYGEVEKTAHKWLENYRKLDAHHSFKQLNSCYPVESYIAPCDFRTDSNELIKEGSWIIAVKVTDKSLWNKIKDGEYNAFSPGGFGRLKNL